jgi:hypothetical protein
MLPRISLAVSDNQADFTMKQEVKVIQRRDAEFPEALESPEITRIWAIGDIEILSRPPRIPRFSQDGPMSTSCRRATDLRSVQSEAPSRSRSLSRA